MVHITETKRLPAIAKCVEGRTMADIGTDHAYLPIMLCLDSQIDRAIATDINRGPLDRAKAHIAAQGLADRIETRLGAGLSTINAGDAACCVVAGMGGLMIVEMIERDLAVARSFSKLVLQPQRDLPEVRRCLLANGFSIETEQMIVDDGKFYNILTCRPRIEQEAYTEIELLFGRHLLREGSAVLHAWLTSERARVNVILTNMRAMPAANEQAEARAAELARYDAICEEAMAWLR